MASCTHVAADMPTTLHPPTVHRLAVITHGPFVQRAVMLLYSQAPRTSSGLLQFQRSRLDAIRCRQAPHSQLSQFTHPLRRHGCNSRQSIFQRNPTSCCRCRCLHHRLHMLLGCHDDELQRLRPVNPENSTESLFTLPTWSTGRRRHECSDHHNHHGRRRQLLVHRR